ncbi:MAG: single-stranded DNA-binding protein [Lachnospiraceae bacterium]|nr:single-stranded DNA-binding protein [Lachnospiraceae bacterium]
MGKGMDENDIVLVSGMIAGEITLDHETYGEKFYCFTLSLMRFSGTEDLLPCLIPGWLYDRERVKPGALVRLFGQLRSYNMHTEGKSHLILNIYVKEMEGLSGCGGLFCNYIHLKGFLCKAPVYRITSKGKEITDCLLAVNLPYGKSAYIPCIFWGALARRTGNLCVGEEIELSGRIQSRAYRKEKETKNRVAYEVSVSELWGCGGKESLCAEEGSGVDEL